MPGGRKLSVCEVAAAEGGWRKKGNEVNCNSGKEEKTSTVLFREVTGCFYADPTTNGGMQNGSSVGIHARCKQVFACLAPICVHGRCLLTNISASELSRNFLKSALLVGQ